MRSILFVFLFLASPAFGQNVRIAGTGEYPPYLMTQSGGGLTGFDVELMSEICSRNNFSCGFSSLTLERALSRVGNHRADVAMGGIGVSAEREAIADFTCPYLFFPARTEYFFAMIGQIDRSQSVIAVTGDSYQSQIVAANGFQVREFTTLSGAIDAVLSGQVDAVFGSRGSLTAFPSVSSRLT